MLDFGIALKPNSYSNAKVGRYTYGLTSAGIGRLGQKHVYTDKLQYASDACVCAVPPYPRRATSQSPSQISNLRRAHHKIELCFRFIGIHIGISISILPRIRRRCRRLTENDMDISFSIKAPGPYEIFAIGCL